MALARLNIPGHRALRRIDRAGPVPWPRSHHSGCVRSRRRTCVRANERQRLQADRRRRLPRRRRLRRPVHRQHHGDRHARRSASAPLGSGSVPATDPDEADVGKPAGEQVMELLEAGRPASRDHHPHGDRKRHRGRGRHRRIDQRRPAPAGDRQGSRRRPRASTISIASARGRRCIADLKPCRTVRRDRPSRGRRQPARRQATDRCRACSHGDALTVTGRTLAEDAAHARRRRRASRSCGRPIDPLKPHGGLVILFGNLAPEGAVLKLSGTETRAASRSRRASSTAKSRLRRRAAADDQAGRRRRHPLRRPERRTRACARCLAVTAAIIGAGLGESVAAAHRRTVLRRHARPLGRPHRAGGVTRRPDRGGPRRRHHRVRCREAHARRRAERRGNRSAPGGLEGAAPRYKTGVWPNTRGWFRQRRSGAITG